MICNKCGAVLPDDATFCGECGATIEKKKKPSAAFAKATADVKRYKIISVILACLCVVMGFCWIHAAHNPYKNIENYEEEAVDINRAGIELSGTYVVGEDEELPEGRYNIYPPKNESYMSVYIYATREDARKKHDADYNSLAIDNLYSLTRGYKLKEGQIVSIEYDSAFFELVSEEPSETIESEETSAPQESESAETQPQSE